MWKIIRLINKQVDINERIYDYVIKFNYREKGKKLIYGFNR